MKYAVVPHTSGDSVSYFVHGTVRIGFSRKPWGKPFYGPTTKSDAERWINDAYFRASPEGAAHEKAKNDAIDQIWEEERKRMEADGFTIYLPAPHSYMNPTTRQTRYASAPFWC